MKYEQNYKIKVSFGNILDKAKEYKLKRRNKMLSLLNKPL